MSSEKDTFNVVKNAVVAIGLAMGSDKYAIVGSAACTMLGSDRRPQNTIDFVVPRGKTIASRRKLRTSSEFNVEPRTNYTRHGSVEIRILTPPILFRHRFDETTATVQVDGVHVLKPALILNAKCKALMNQYLVAEKEANAEDVVFLLNWHATNGVRLSPTETPSVTRDFVRWLVQERGGDESWEAAGFSFERGKSFNNWPVGC